MSFIIYNKSDSKNFSGIRQIDNSTFKKLVYNENS